MTGAEAEAVLTVNGTMQAPLEQRKRLAKWLRAVATDIERANPTQWAKVARFRLSR